MFNRNHRVYTPDSLVEHNNFEEQILLLEMHGLSEWISTHCWPLVQTAEPNATFICSISMTFAILLEFNI